ncbi:MAG: EpsG family protein [Microcystaceae cyanobacterium]
MLQYNQLSEVIFFFLEFLYAVLSVIYIFSSVKILLAFIYPLAAFKFGLSSLEFFDTKNYQDTYDFANKLTLEPVMGQEGAFVSLLYIFKSLNLPLFFLHGIEIIAFLLAAKFLFEAFMPSEKAIAVSLILGLFAGMGEIGLYLLRQLLSTAIVFVALGFLFRGKNRWAWLFLAIACVFHSSSFLYIPLFATSFVGNKYGKAALVIALYGGFALFLVNSDLGLSLLESTSGKNSLYTEKYSVYSQFSGKTGWRDGVIGVPSLVMLAYFTGINIWKKAWFWKSPNWMYYYFMAVFTAFYLILEKSKIFWISSRISVISDILILTSCILITIEIIPPKDHKLMFLVVFMLLVPVSMRNILLGYDGNVLFRFPL